MNDTAQKRQSSIARLTQAPAGRFAVVGSVGFVVDAAILTFIANVAGMGVYLPRLISFPVALLCTWQLNRIWTFPGAADQKRLSQYGRYAAVQITGALLNLAIYALVIFFGPDWFGNFVGIPLAIASGTAMVFNYFGARYWAFRVMPPDST